MTFADIQWDMILGGFGLFMFGIKFMGDGLKSLAGDKLRDYIDKYTSKPLLAVLIGAIVTIMIQSSSATTAITIGLVRAGLMKLEQAAGIVFGANIGTTITAFLIGLKVEQYAMYFVFLGGIIISFCSRKKTRYLGEVILGFGLLFYGLRIMGDSLKMLKDLPEFLNFATLMGKQPLLALIAGTILTAIIQGSAATIGVVQKLYEAGAMELSAALPFVFGSNIGTTITGVIAALGGSLAARRTACLHTLFNVIGTAVAMLLLYPYIGLIQSLSKMLNIAPMMQVAVAHIIFNVTATVLFFPFLKQLCNLVKKIMPGQEAERTEIIIDELDTTLIHQLPASALNVAQIATVQMAAAADAMVKDTRAFCINNSSSEDKDIIIQSESLINNLDTKITDYLMMISKEELSDREMSDLNLHLQVIKNIERIGDLTVNLVEFFDMVHEVKEEFSDEALADIHQMFEVFSKMYEQSIFIYDSRDISLFSSLQEDEEYLDALEAKARQKHFERMAKQECTSAIAGSVYCDILGNLERMGDHCLNIAKWVIDAEQTANGTPHSTYHQYN